MKSTSARVLFPVSTGMAHLAHQPYMQLGVRLGWHRDAQESLSTTGGFKNKLDKCGSRMILCSSSYLAKRRNR